jgi:hypothetical protein
MQPLGCLVQPRGQGGGGTRGESASHIHRGTHTAPHTAPYTRRRPSPVSPPSPPLVPTFGCSSNHVASSIALDAIRSHRRDSVSRPWRSKNEPNGFWHGPWSRSPSTRARRMKAAFTPRGPLGPKVSQNFMPWYLGEMVHVRQC